MGVLTINLWFDHEAEEAAKFYTEIFPNSSIGRVVRYPEVGQEITGGTPGSVMTVEFSLDGQPFIGLNGGDQGFHFTEATSFVVYCDTQEEIDRYWDALTAGGNEVACGWLKDKYGVSWQIVPKILDELIADPDKGKSERATQAMLKMKKLVIADLEAAARG